MSLRALLDRVIARPGSHRRRQPAPRPNTFRLAFDSLEDRLTPAAMLTIGDATIVEGNAGVQNALVNVHLTEPHGNSVTVHYSTVDGSATAGSDYNAVSGNLTFPRNVMNKSILIPIPGDRLVESGEYFYVVLSNGKGAKIADSTGLVSITNDEPYISVYDASVVEGDTGTTTMQFAVYLSNSYDLPVTVQYATSDGSATSDPSQPDYVPAVAMLTFGPNNTTPQMITVDVIGDEIFEPTEYFQVNVTTPNSYAGISRGAAYGTIWNDEPPPPEISISDASVVEGDTGTTSIQFTVSLSNSFNLPVTVQYATRDGSATAGSDYQPDSGTLTFAPNDSTPQIITIEVIGDQAAEPDKSFFVDVTTPDSYATISRGTGVGTIWDDEPRIFIYDAYNYGDYSPFTFTVTVANLDPGETVTVDWETMDGTAFAGVDYEGANGTLTFTADAPTQSITINVIDPTSAPDKYFYIHLTNPSSNATIYYEWAAGYWYYDYGYYDPGCCWYDPWYYGY
jgi:chitinase